MRFLLLVFLAFTAFTAPATAQQRAVTAKQTTDGKSQYIGYKYNGVNPDNLLPIGVKYLGGGLISDSNVEPIYGIASVTKGKTQMLWLEISTGKTADGSVSGWQVKDVLVFPPLTKNQSFHYSYDPSVSCQQNKTEPVKLVVLGEILVKQGRFKASRAWIANTKTEKFEEIPVRGLRCEYSEP